LQVQFASFFSASEPELHGAFAQTSGTVREKGVTLFPGEVQLDLFLQTSEQDGFYVMAKNLDMREVMAEEGRNMDELPDCAG